MKNLIYLIYLMEDRTMSKYIERSKTNDEIIRVLEHTDCNDKYIDDVLRAIEKLPTIEVSADCISREQVRAKLDYISYAEKDPISIAKRIVENAPSVVPEPWKGADDDYARN